MILKWPWPSGNWEEAVLGRIIRAGFPRLDQPVTVVVNAHPPHDSIRTPDNLQETITNLLTEYQIAPVVESCTVITRGRIPHGLLRLTLTPT